MGSPPPLPALVVKHPGRPLIGLLLGILGLFVWLVPPIGLPVTIFGLVLGANALRRPEKGLAIAATILCVIGLALSSLNLVWGLFQEATKPSATAEAKTGEESSPDPSALPDPPGLLQSELSLASATLYGHWVEEDLLFDDESEWNGSVGVLGEVDGMLVLVTNAHCLGLDELFAADGSDAPEIKTYSLAIEFSSGKKAPVVGMAIRKDRAADIALLAVDASEVKSGEDYVTLPFDDNAKAKEGDEVVAVGSPFGLSGTQTFGRVSAIRTNKSAEKTYKIIQVDAAINHGNSGGPLFLRRQNRFICIGFNTEKIDGADNIGFAIDPAVLDSNQFAWFEATPGGLMKFPR